jgi:hypothetical protein
VPPVLVKWGFHVRRLEREAALGPLSRAHSRTGTSDVPISEKVVIAMTNRVDKHGVSRGALVERRWISGCASIHPDNLRRRTSRRAPRSP